jgi:long-chain acyl-CoA synthetase
VTDRPWLRAYPKEVQPSYTYPKQNLARFLLETAATYPTHPALTFLGKRMTYRELLDSAFRFAGALRRIGIRRGDRVAIMLPNCPQTVIAYYGTLMTGAIVVQTNPLYVERELETQMRDSGAILIVTLDLLYRRVRNVQPNTGLKYMIITSIQDYLPFPKNVLYPLIVKRDGLKRDVTYGGGVFPWNEALASSEAVPLVEEVDAERDIALLQYTGGTTGTPKGAMLSHYNLTANTLQAKAWCYRSKPGRERYLAALPFFHVFGMTALMNLSVVMGGVLILVPKFNSGEILKVIAKEKPTAFPGAPTMYVALLNHPRVQAYDLGSINLCISGAAPLPVEVQEQFERVTGGRLIEGYGLTEASPVTHVNNIWELRKKGSIGIPVPDTIARVVDPETGEELPPGEIGELAIEGPQVMLGYWNRPEETANALKNGVLYTGDMAKMDEDGFFYIIDRKKDIIIASGFNIYPREIEEVLYEHPAVQDAVVAGIPDPYRGETVKAYITLKTGASVTEPELLKFCRDRLAAYKVPRVIEFRSELPKSLVGKILRRKLVEEELERLNGEKDGRHG